MKESLKAIVLGTIRHSDRHNVTNVFTRQRGRMAFLTPAGSSKKGRHSGSRLLPLSVVEIQATVSATRDLHIPSSISQMRVWRTIYFDPLKSTVAMFLSEFLLRFLREAPPEPNLWDFIADSMEVFDNSTDSNANANFHIAFLIGLLPLAGIQPDLDNYSEGMEFDMNAGTMILPAALQASQGARLDARQSAFLPLLSRINFANSRCFRFKGSERSMLVDMILKYYGCHFPGCDRLKSLDILREIYS